MRSIAMGTVFTSGIALGVYFMTVTTNTGGDDWQRQWSARQTALEGLFGPADEAVLHSPVPFYLDGAADVLVFRKHNEGVVFVTAGLIGDDRSRPNSLGQYELMICTPDDSDWAPRLISNLAKYTVDAVLNPNDTMEMGPALPSPTELSAFLYLLHQKVEVDGEQAAVMLCLGITPSELEFLRNNDVAVLVQALKAAGVYPMTDLSRASVQLP